MKQPLPGLEFFTNILNALPSPLFVIDDDVQALYLNSAASGFPGKAGEEAYMKRGGEVLHCLHAAENPEGCGHAAVCGECVIRNSIREAFRGKKPGGIFPETISVWSSLTIHAMSASGGTFLPSRLNLGTQISALLLHDHICRDMQLFQLSGFDG